MKSKASRISLESRPRNRRKQRLARRQLWAVAALSLLGATIAAVLTLLDEKPASGPEQMVSIYRAHGCACALEWKRALEKAGFHINMFETDSLKPIRASLQTPQQLRGCHVGVYLGYFLEGHVPAGALKKLAAERPSATGAVMTTSWMGRDVNFSQAESDQPIMLLDKRGAVRRWVH